MSIEKLPSVHTISPLRVEDCSPRHGHLQPIWADLRTEGVFTHLKLVYQERKKKNIIKVESAEVSVQAPDADGLSSAVLSPPQLACEGTLFLRCLVGCVPPLSGFPPGRGALAFRPLASLLPRDFLVGSLW